MAIATLAFGIIKLSVLWFYRRIFVGRIFNVYSVCACVVVVAWLLSFFFATVFQCRTEPWAYWGSYRQYFAYCDKTDDEGIALVISDLVTDLLVLVTPIPIIWRLHTRWVQKWSLMGCFLLGFL